MLPRATDPKWIEAGATEILAASGASCWLDADLDAPVKPTQPALEMARNSDRISNRKEVALPLSGLDCVALFSAPVKQSFVVRVFM